MPDQATREGTLGPKKAGRKTLFDGKQGEARLALLMIFPGLGLLVAMFMLPIVLAVYDSFFSINTVSRERHFVGVGNYSWLLTDPSVASAFVRSLIYVVSLVAGEVVVGLFLAVLLNQRCKSNSFFRSIVVFPYIMPTIVVVLIWKYLMEPTYGVLNHLLAVTHISSTGLGWLSDPGTAFPSVIFISIWKFAPFMTLMFLARLQSVPKELYEAASLDGGGSWAQFRHISLPWLAPVLVVAVLIRSIWGFNEFDIVYLPARGGPLDATTTLPVLIRQIAFSSLDLGRASAVAIGMALFLICVVLIGFKAFRRGSDNLT